ncbi:GNAT family N-acetyltransferase [Halapricum salinum]|uniref:GNAT family N-acetyltransferase n=2 Tax=Halapricum salinum TaxID=1457250 RepID=A0A4D6HD52_9EURY|nr:GNAT family N-acetyltransferase [Halapricum salinum]
MPDVSVRTAKPGDAEAVLEVKRAAIEELAARAYTPVELEAWAPDDDAIEEYRSAMSADQFQILVAEDDDTIAGYGVLNAEQSRVEALFVRPFWARLGIATRLLRQLEMSAAFDGCETLSVVSSLNAVGFYEALGYDRVEQRSRTIDGVDIEFTLLEKDLSTRAWAAQTE